MRNDTRPIGIGTIRFSAMWAWVYHCKVLHRNDVDVETARTESYGWHATEEPLELLDAREHFNCRRSWLIGECGAHLQRSVEELWLINETDWGGAIERRNLLKVPSRNVRKRDDRLCECRDRVVEVGPDSQVQDEFTHVPDGTAA
jgi:hypothetical protein